MKFNLLIQLVSLIGAQVSGQSNNLEIDITGQILKPVEGKSGEQAAVIFLIGDECDHNAYVDQLKMIQEKVPFPLWVAIPKIAFNTPIPVGISVYMDAMKANLKLEHGFDAKKYFYGGHSLGGASTADWVHKNLDDAEGAFLWGAYVGHKVEDPVKNYGVPVLTVGAQYDGWMARITRIAQSFDQMMSSPIEDSFYKYPVVMIPGADHASFLSGIPPSKVQETDLRATAPFAQIQEQIADVVSAFITYTRLGKESVEGKQAQKVIDYQIQNVTAPMMQPILDLYKIEGAPFMSSFENVTPWVVEAQKHVAGDLLKTHKIEVIDQYEAFTPPSGNFSHAKPNITKNGDTEDIFSYSHQTYNWRTGSSIDAADFYAASDVGAKLKSRAAIYHYYNETMNVNETTCQELNQIAFKYVRENFSGDKSVLDLFDKIGQPLEFVEDTNSPSGILWVNEGSTYTNTTTSMQVSARQLLSAVDFMVPKAAGMLYCKLMSPARILEWIMVDGLKQKMYWAPRPEDQETAFLQ